MTDMQIECFLAVAKHLNFTEAASQLFIAQSSLSRNISNLEDELDVQLFVRTKKYVRLTPGGAVLYKEFSRLTQEIRTAVEMAKQADLGTEGSLRLGVIETQRSENFLPQSLGILRKDYPGIHIDLYRGNFKDLRVALEEDRIDIALTMDFDLKEYEPFDVVFQPFFVSEAKCVISSYHRLANAQHIDMLDLKDDNLIAISPEVSKGAYANAFELCQRYGFTPKHIRYANSVQDLLLMVEAGLGYSILDENCTSNLNPVVRSIPIQHTDPLQLVAVWKKQNLNPAVPLFANILIDSASIIN